MKRFISAAALLGLSVVPHVVSAGEFIDTRLVFIAGDDNFGADAGITVPNSQVFDIGPRSGYDLIFDARDSAETGRESRTHLVLHRASEGYFNGLTTEAAIVMEVLHSRIQTNDPRSIRDDGSFLRLEKALGDSSLRATFMPFDSDRIRLGYLWDITWAGNRVFPSSTLTPALELEWLAPGWDLHAGAKTARIQFKTDDDDPRNGQIEAFAGVFAGFGIGDKKGGLRLDAEGGFFEKGLNPNGLVRGEPIDASGVSLRLSYVDGLPFGVSTNTRFYSANPVAPWNAANPFPGQTRWRVAAEFTQLGQTLEDPDTTGGTIVETARAAAAYGTFQFGPTRLSVRGIFRDVPFLFFDHPGALVRYQAISEDLDQAAEITGYATLEHHLESLHLTPGLSLGFQQPASVSTVIPEAGIHAPDVLTGRSSVIFRRADMFDDTGLMSIQFLPEQAEVEPVISARAHTRLDLAEGFGVVGQISVTHDPNRVEFSQDRLNVNSVRIFDDPLVIGGSVMARAEF